MWRRTGTAPPNPHKQSAAKPLVRRNRALEAVFPPARFAANPANRRAVSVSFAAHLTCREGGFLGGGAAKGLWTFTKGCATFGVVLCLFSPLFRPKRNVGRGRTPSDFVDAALFAAQGVSCLRPRRGDCAGEKRTLLPVTSPAYAAFCLNVPRIGGRGLLGSAVGGGRHLTRRCSRRRPREHGDERHPRHCHHRNRRHHCRHKAHQAHKATFFPVRLLSPLDCL